MNNIKYVKRFGIEWFIYSIIDAIYQFIFHNVNPKIFLKRVEIAKNYLYKKYYYVIDETLAKPIFNENICTNTKVFVLWEQGIESMPGIVKMCIKSIKEHSGDRELLLLDKQNIISFCDDYNNIKYKFDRGIFAKNFLSDFLKGYILYNYGGVWLDATIYLNDDLDKLVDSNSKFWTINHGDIGRENYNKWAAYAFASGKYNRLFYLLYRMFYEYIKNENKFIYYFLIDAVIQIAYEKLPECRDMIDSVNAIGYDVDGLCNILNMKYDKRILNNLLMPINKLSYKINIDKNDNIYNYLYNVNFNKS